MNSARYATKILKKDKTIVDESGNSYLLNVNSYIEDLELYIENNYDVEIMYFGRDYLADESHIWGSGRTHYEKSYYSDKFNQLKHIVEFDNISKKECSQPSRPSEPNITAGRFLTLSAPFRLVMLSFPYSCFFFGIN